MAGRKKDPVWLYFSEIATVSGKGLKAKCKKCGKEMMGLVARLKKHQEICENPTDDTGNSKIESDKIDSPPNSCSSQQMLCNITVDTANQQKRKASENEMQCTSKRKIDSYVFKTSSNQKNVIDKQVARFVYATNSSFRSVENKEFKNMIAMLRPGYIPPTCKEVGGVLLEQIYNEERQKCLKVLEGQTVSMSLDGWSNIHNEPIICSTISTCDGNLYLVDSIDTSGHPHTKEYLVKIAQEAISKCQFEFKCFIRSLVTDNAANVKSMREEFENDENYDIITYGCSAHLLNLLASDLQVPDVKEHIVYVVKYFRNNHFAAAKYRQEGGQKLVMPQDVRWNTMFDCLSTYIKHWPTLMKICEEHREQIDKVVSNKVLNFSIKRNAEDLVNRLEPIAISLDSIQKDNCSIAGSVDIWKKLEEKFIEQKLEKKNFKCFSTRYDQALGAPHFLAYLIDPRFCGSKLTEMEKKKAFEFANNKYSTSFMPLIMKFLAKADPFYPLLFEENITSKMSPLEWWRVHFKTTVCEDDQNAIKQLLSAVATSASVERIFSAYGLVHSTLRNKLGQEKAGKLVFLYKALNLP